MTERVAEGANYTIDLVDAIGLCRAWSRPDLDHQQGAQLAVELSAVLGGLARGKALAVLLDFSAAPPVTGPKTQEALGELLQSWYAVRKPVALVVGAKSMQLLQMRRLLSTFVPERSALFSSVDEAMIWLLERVQEPR